MNLGRRSLSFFALLVVLLSVASLHAQGVTELKRAAERGDSAAQLRLGLAYRDGLGVPVDQVEAYVWLSLAGVFASGDDRAVARKAAAKLAERMTAAQLEQSEKRGTALVRQQSDAGTPWAQTFLGIVYLDGTSADLPKDPVLGRQLIEKAAGQNQREAQFLLGTFYLRGAGGPRDPARAMDWLLKAATQGHPEAQSLAGDGYFSGQGVLQEYPLALYWWRKAAAQGVAAAQASLGDSYRLGDRGVDRDLAEAARWYRLAADQGDAWAQSNLGAMYSNGAGVPQDNVEAIKLISRAAEQGHPHGLYNLGVAYAGGFGVPVDFVEAHKWLNLAAARATTDQQAIATERDTLAKRMTPAQVAEAQLRAREWLDTFNRNGRAPVIPPPPPSPAAPLGVSGGLPAAPLRVGGAIKEPVKTKHVEAVYPSIAISARIQGVVIIEATIGVDGRVTDARLLSAPNPLLDTPALAAVRQWEYQPTLFNGVPVPVIVTATINFSLK